MASVRNVLLSFVSSSALYSGLSSALGLGEISLYSALNQPLDAKIELLEVGELNADEVLARLASPEVFARSGVDRFYFLNDLRFTPVLQGAGSFIRVVSSKPIREPYLNFVVELERPAGRLLREYTLLLDPPGSSNYQTAGQPPQSVAAEAAPQRPANTPSAVPPPPALDGRRYSVVRGDSLWAIAEGLRAGGSQVGVSELMQGIHALNPQAFVDNDIGRLKLGANLLLPDAAEPAVATNRPAVPAAEAAREVPPEGVQRPEAVSVAEPPDMLVLDEAAESYASRIAELQRQADDVLAARAEESLQLRKAIDGLQLQVQQLQVQMDSKDALLARLQAAPREGVVPAGRTPAEPAAVRGEQSSWLSGSWMGGLLIGTLLLLVLQFMVLLALLPRLRRNRPGAAEGAPAPIMPAAQALTVVEAEPVAPMSPSARDTPARAPAASTDALEGANIYIAYGRFSEAAGVLKAALVKEPERSDLRFRLLEVLAELGDPAGFIREQATLRESGFSEMRLEQLQARYPRLATAAPLVLDEVIGVPEESRQLLASNELLDDFQLNLDDLSLDAEWDNVSPFEPGVASRKKAPEPQPPLNDPAFRSNLVELPEVLELDEQDYARGDFPVSGGEIAGEEFSDAFSDLIAVDLRKQRIPRLAEENDLDHLAGDRGNLGKLNQALAYISQGNIENACDILNQVISEGDDQQKQEARELLARIA
ncbi:MAG TPA: FimV/HubP family polar landmark protein [Pseudomonas sp.]|nr:FimV/HubP family polar landmark protein [Pseudomonas sp.]